MSHAIRRAVATLMTALSILSAFACFMAAPALGSTPRIVAKTLDPNPVQYQRCRITAQVLDNHGRGVSNVVVTFAWKIDGHVTAVVKAKTGPKGIAMSSGHVGGGVPWRLDSVGISARLAGKKLLAPAYFQPLPAIWPGHPVTIRIGVAGPVTGGAGVLGQGVARGALLAIRQFNASSTVSALGINFMGMVADDQGDPDVAVAAAKHLTADPRLLGVEGHLNSACSIAASGLYTTARVPMVTPVSTNPELTQLGRANVFRACANDNSQGSKGGLIAYGLGLHKAYVIDDSMPYGEGLANTFATSFLATGGTVVDHVHTLDTDTTFTAVVTAVKNAKPDVVYYGGIYNGGALLAQGLHDASVTATFMGDDGIFDPAFSGIAGSAAASGAVCTNIGYPVDHLPNGTDFLLAYAARYGTQPEIYDAYAYDATRVILSAILAEAQTRGTWVLGLSGYKKETLARVAATNMEGVTGPVSFGAHGERQQQDISYYKMVSGAWAFQGMR